MWLYILIFSLISGLTWAQAPHFSEYSHVLRNGRIISNGLFAEKSPSLQEIERVLPRLKSDIDFLDYLRLNFPSLKNNYVLVHRTESQQLSSLTHPRVIVFGGGSAFSFSEEPSQKKRKVEMLFTNTQTYEISLHEISFENQRATLHKNPSSCTACHGSPARPLWNPYDFWPNTFGSAIGMMGTVQEKSAYTRLHKLSQTSPLLQRLKLPSELNLETEAVSAFTQYIGKINMGRWIRQHLPKGTLFDQYAKPFVAAAGFCLSENEGSNRDPVSYKKLNRFLRPEEILKNRDLFYQIHRDQYFARQHFKNYLDKVLLDIHPQPRYLLKVDHSRLGYETDILSLMRWLLILSGVNTQDMSTSLIGNDSLQSLPTDFSMEFLISLLEARPDLFKDIPFKQVDVIPGKLAFLKFDCAALSQASLKQARDVSEKMVFQSFTNDIKERPVISRCSKCHAESLASAPYIAFDNPQKLAEQLQDPDKNLKSKIEKRINLKGRSQMPPQHPLNAQEKAALLAYLENLM